MTSNVNNNVFELSVTPSRKRKREFEKISEGLINPSFSLANNGNEINKENIMFTPHNVCLEEKSISEIASKKLNTISQEHEVIRKPPKKKKKSDIEKACFVNPALNLTVPEKRFNPFEVKRPSSIATKTHCFVNKGLNIRSEDNSACFNPFEISREKQVMSMKQGIENPALELSKSLAIALPFTPTVGCRIDFSKISLENLTPSKLLERKLVFSPSPNFKEKINDSTKFRQSLSVISEEIDIGKELDCYQLELENSINEAKSKKSTKPLKQLFDSPLADIEEIDTVDNLNSNFDENSPLQYKEENSKKEAFNCNEEESTENKNQSLKQELKKSSEFDETNDEHEINNDDDEFEKPAPFTRCYRKANKIVKSTVESSKTADGKVDAKKEKNAITNAIRNSFRSIIRTVKNQDKVAQNENNNLHKTSNTGGHLIETIRQSLRIKKLKQKSKEEEEKTVEGHALADISIIDNTERKIFRSNSVANLTANTNDSHSKKFNVKSDLRRSSRRIKNNVYKTFNKNTANYDFVN